MDERQKLFDKLMARGLGSFGWVHSNGKKIARAVVVEYVDDYNEPISSDEVVVRYATLTTLASSKNPIYPMVKINQKTERIYFLTGSGKFEKRGNKLDYLRLYSR